LIKAIIFDFDGVIVESVDIKTKAFAKLFCHEGPAVAEAVVEYHLQNSGVSRFDKFAYIYNNILHRRITEAIFNDLCNKFSQLVVNEVINAPYVEGAEEFLKEYVKEYKFFVVSATPQEEIESIIEKRGMSGCFSTVYGAPGKKTDLVRKIIKDNSLTSRELIYIGDALSDYEAAKENSVEFIARINNNSHLFDDKLSCLKVKNLINLKNILENISKI